MENASHPDIDIFTLERDLDFLDNPDRFEEELGEWLVPGMSQWQGRYGDCDEDDEL